MRHESAATEREAVLFVVRGLRERGAPEHVVEELLLRFEDLELEDETASAAQEP